MGIEVREDGGRDIVGGERGGTCGLLGFYDCVLPSTPNETLEAAFGLGFQQQILPPL